MANNPFRSKVKDIKDIQFWVDETFKEYKESNGEEPVAAFVILFVKNDTGKTVAVTQKTFQAGDNYATNGDVIKALADAEFKARFDLAMKVRSNVAKKK